MLVKYTRSTCLIILAAEELDGDAGFSGREIGQQIDWPIGDVLNTLDLHAEHDICTRLDDNWSNPTTAETRWCLNRPSLTEGSVYEVLAIEDEYYRLLNDATHKPYGNDPLLFHASLFEIIDSAEPTFWHCTAYEDGERQCSPPAWQKPGFFERFHDGEVPLREQFWRDIRQYYPRTATERKLPMR